MPFMPIISKNGYYVFHYQYMICGVCFAAFNWNAVGC